MELQKATAIVEAILMASEGAVSLKRLTALLPDVPPEAIREALDRLRDVYRHDNPEHGVELVQVAGGWLFRTRADLSPWVRRLFEQAPLRLSRAMLEVLAIVAYRQPVTRAEIEAVRGVDSAASLRSLLERDLIRIVGKKDMPGRPQLFGTGKRFLEVFGLKNLGDLPPLDDEQLSDLQQKLPLDDAAILPNDEEPASHSAFSVDVHSEDELEPPKRAD